MAGMNLKVYIMPSKNNKLGNITFNTHTKVVTRTINKDFLFFHLSRKITQEIEISNSPYKTNGNINLEP